MYVGVLSVRLYLHGVRSLKEKRSIVAGIRERTRSRFNVAVAEVEHLDSWQTAGMGFSVVSNDGSRANSVLDQVVDYIEGLGLAELQDHSIEILSV